MFPAIDARPRANNRDWLAKHRVHVLPQRLVYKPQQQQHSKPNGSLRGNLSFNDLETPTSDCNFPMHSTCGIDQESAKVAAGLRPHLNPRAPGHHRFPV